jgi:ABC-type transporter Mla maintaining outer membrane lipid asymmetry ATPase subunit MlaF
MDTEINGHAHEHVISATRAGPPGGGGPVIEVAGVRKAFGGAMALAGVDLIAEPGRVLALLGPNGADKPATGL